MSRRLFQLSSAFARRMTPSLVSSTTAPLSPPKEKVCLIGSGNWGSAIARIVGQNVAAHPDLFHPEVNMWVYEEMIDDRKLTDIINTSHENAKYLPGIKLPACVRAVPDLLDAAKDATVLVFVVPHQVETRARTFCVLIC